MLEREGLPLCWWPLGWTPRSGWVMMRRVSHEELKSTCLRVCVTCGSGSREVGPRTCTCACTCRTKRGLTARVEAALFRSCVLANSEHSHCSLQIAQIGLCGVHAAAKANLFQKCPVSHAATLVKQQLRIGDVCEVKHCLNFGRPFTFQEGDARRTCPQLGRRARPSEIRFAIILRR